MTLGSDSFLTSVVKLLIQGTLMVCSTILILVLMNGFSIILHALRLQWIEFGSKFIDGDGVKYNPIKVPC